MKGARWGAIQLAATKFPQFTAEQRQRLQVECTLLPEQVQELEKTLRLSQAELRKPARMADVRSSLKATEKPLGNTLEAISILLRGSTTAETEARNRVLMAEFETRGTASDTLETALQTLTAAKESVQAALYLLPSEQRRGGSAIYTPIWRIEQALLRGFCNHHTGQPLPPYMLRTSRTQPPFPQIVAICYEAIGILDTKAGNTPDRAIRAYLQLKKKVREKHKEDLNYLELRGASGREPT